MECISIYFIHAIPACSTSAVKQCIIILIEVFTIPMFFILFTFLQGGFQKHSDQSFRIY